ncbi:APC family permease [Halomarina litorea]|uniref:APC family permease n=1 Tax=Halomarina litorea TaxID=2961595 RepID=UPI0020C45721|nr:APC family permease [Halomarina sp. BCD28]
MSPPAGPAGGGDGGHGTSDGGSDDGTDGRLTDRVGLPAVLVLLVGNAVSVPIYVLSGPLAGGEGLGAGPAVVLAAVLAAIPAGFVVLYNALLGSAVPVAGGLYVYISRLTAPFWGFLVPWTLPLVVWATLLVTATGFAEYARFFVDVPAIVLMYVLLAGVVALNVVGLRLVVQAQALFVAGLALALLAFVVPGATAVDPANYTPVLPDAGAFGVAAVALFYPFLGFGLLTELGEEIDDPGRTIPLALGIGIVVVAVCYVALIAVLVGVVPWRELGHPADVALAARRFLPPWGVSLVAAGALFAVVTSVNTSVLVASRTVMRAGRDGILPESVSRIHPRFDTPWVAVLVLGGPPFLLVPLADDVVGLSAFIGLASLTAYFFSAVGLWNLPREFPAHYAAAPFRLRRDRGLPLAVLGGALATGAFWVVTLVRLPTVGVVLVGWFLLGYAYYRHRLRGVDRVAMYRRMTTLADHEGVARADRPADGRESDA